MEQWFALFIIEHSSQQEVCRFESWFLCGVCLAHLSGFLGLLQVLPPTVQRHADWG